MDKRKRVASTITGELIEAHSLIFTKNKCSPNARMVFTNAESLVFDIWFDKHYYIRERHGDENGKRDGIDPDAVKNCVLKAAKHLIFYAIKLRNFSFVNFGVVNRPERVILTLEKENEINLNIVTEYHHLSLNRYEVTVKTALRKNDFYFGDGDYQVTIHEDGSSTLFRKERGKVNSISEYLSP